MITSFLNVEAKHRYFLELAREVSTYSQDPSTAVGAVFVAPNNVVIAAGTNRFIKGVAITPERLERPLKYDVILHGEMDALKYVLAQGASLAGATLYTYPFSPCVRCGMICSHMGITEIVTLRNDTPRWQEQFKIAERLYREVGVTYTVLDPGFLDGNKLRPA